MQGSGSGHEPAHVMIVGKGMLDAACPGDVFAAPPMDYVYETTKLLASPKGVLLLVNNYTGDRMAFDMGKEMAEAEGIKVEILMINDDVAVKDSTWTVGRRGVAGNFFVIKAVGAAAEQGADLDELLRIGQQGQRRDPHDGRRRSPPAPRRPRARRCSSSATTRSRWASASTASPAASARSSTNADAIADELLDAVVARPAVPVGRPRGADGQRPRRHPDQRALHPLPAGPPAARGRAASRSGAATSASTAPRSTWPAPRSPWSSSTTRSSDLLAAPAEVAIRTF